MDWKAEAKAVIEDVKPYVSSIEIVQSGEDRIYLEIKTLEEIKLNVTLDSNGFSICDNGQSYNTNDRLQLAGKSDKGAYETIYALLNDTSVKYREAFATDLTDKMKTFKER